MKHFLLPLILLALVACASSKKEKLDIKDKASQSTVTDAQALSSTIDQAINNSNLTPEQKTKLNGIVEENKTLAKSLTEESFRYRSLLVKELFAEKSSKKRIRYIEKDIKRVEQARLKNTFDTVKKMSAVLNGHPDKSEFQQHMENFAQERMGPNSR